MGSDLDIVAPSGSAYAGGEKLRSTDLLGDRGMGPLSGDHDYTDAMAGTSGSAPLVSGVIALMYGANPRLSEAEVREVGFEHDPARPRSLDEDGVPSTPRQRLHTQCATPRVEVEDVATCEIAERRKHRPAHTVGGRPYAPGRDTQPATPKGSCNHTHRQKVTQVTPSVPNGPLECGPMPTGAKNSRQIDPEWLAHRPPGS